MVATIFGTLAAGTTRSGYARPQADYRV